MISRIALNVGHRLLEPKSGPLSPRRVMRTLLIYLTAVSAPVLAVILFGAFRARAIGTLDLIVLAFFASLVLLDIWIGRFIAHLPARAPYREQFRSAPYWQANQLVELDADAVEKMVANIHREIEAARREVEESAAAIRDRRAERLLVSPNQYEEFHAAMRAIDAAIREADRHQSAIISSSIDYQVFRARCHINALKLASSRRDVDLYRVSLLSRNFGIVGLGDYTLRKFKITAAQFAIYFATRMTYSHSHLKQSPKSV